MFFVVGWIGNNKFYLGIFFRQPRVAFSSLGKDYGLLFWMDFGAQIRDQFFSNKFISLATESVQSPGFPFLSFYTLLKILDLIWNFFQFKFMT